MKKSKEMQKHISSWRESGLSMKEYCRQKGISHNSFYYWKRKYAIEENNPKETGQSKDLSFIQLDCSQERSYYDSSTTTGQKDNQNQAQVTLTFPSGLCLKIYG